MSAGLAAALIAAQATSLQKASRAGALARADPAVCGASRQASR
jgi:hypothetical protein